MAAFILKSILRPPSAVAIVMLGVYMTLWGIWVANPFWTVFTSSTIYHTMAAFAPEWFYGTGAIICGVLITYGAVLDSYFAKTAGSLLGALHWVSLSTLYFIGDWHNTGAITTLFVAATSAYLYLSTVINRYARDREDDLR